MDCGWPPFQRTRPFVDTTDVLERIDELLATQLPRENFERAATISECQQATRYTRTGKIDRATVSSCVAFVEGLLLKHF